MSPYIGIVDLGIYIEIEGDELYELRGLISATTKVRWGADLSFDGFWHFVV